MSAARFFRHIFSTRRATRRRFDEAAFAAIEGAVHASEALHQGEIRFAVESGLDPRAIFSGQTPAARARQLFGELEVWNTAHNSGVLIYVLVADRAVEIVADRGFAGRIDAGEWSAACRAMETEFSRGRYREGSVAGIEAVGRIVARVFPPDASNPNELADRPVLL